MRGPQLPIKSIYLFPSTSVIQAPFPLWIKRGVPPTLLNAQTGEFTPPGIVTPAFLNNSLLREISI